MWCWLLLLSGRWLVAAHLALTFPPARFPPLDFLDTSRTQAPCGVPRPRNPHFTTYFVGESYNFTWRMQYPHQGGFRLSLFDSSGELVERLSPSNSLHFAGVADQTTQSERVRFTKSCLNCTVLLERQALEWGKSYQFRSCADVNVLEGLATDEERCSSHGNLVDGACICAPKWTGDVCQYRADCESDTDCGRGGRCVFEGSALVHKTCFCAFGLFGTNCERKFDGQTDACFNYEGDEERELFSHDCFHEETLNTNDRVWTRVVGDDVEIILDFASSSWVALGWRPHNLDPSCRLFPDLEGVRYKRSSMNTTNEGVPRRVTQDGPRPLMPKDNGLLESALKAPLHAMDCIDVVVASVREGRLRIQDMYSRDRSTPLDDTWFIFLHSLTLQPTDHPLRGHVFAVWAKGQTAGAYRHITPSAVDGQRFSDKNFYPDDELKYHGSENRGVHPLNFDVGAKKIVKSQFGVKTLMSSSASVVEMSASNAFPFPSALLFYFISAFSVIVFL